MKFERHLFANAAMLAAVWYFTIPQPAHAYFDLATGTYIYQLIFGVGAAFWFSFMGKIPFFGKKKKANASANTNATASSESGEQASPPAVPEPDSTQT